VLLMLVATLSTAIGVVVERWLFFAEAEHVAMLYYGRQQA
jgi:sulfite dehydrogenase (quinone) subunit SoeC